MQIIMLSNIVTFLSFSAAPHGEVLMDNIICKGNELQYCYQYLRRVERGISLAVFHANPSTPEGSPEDCLPILMKYVTFTTA